MPFKVIDVSEFLLYPFMFDEPLSTIWISKKGKRKKCYLELYMGFDIETYTTEKHNGYMYIWQFSIYGKMGNYIIIGRTWGEFKELIDTLIEHLDLCSMRRVIIGVANLSFEHQFIKRHFAGRWTNIFAKEKRTPIYAVIDDCIEFRDILMITGGSLYTLAKEYTTTQKLKGDLDYSIPRNYTTQLTDKELQYCYNDVAIVSEFMQYLFDTYIKPDKYIPLTKTGLLRREVKKELSAKGSGVKRQIMREIYRCYPDNFDFYSILMQYCFRGGYCHSNLRHTGHVIEGVSSYDITSSYPYTMLAYDGFPVSPLKRENPCDFWGLYNQNKYCLIFRVAFTGLKAITDHSIESKSKCLTIPKNAIIDNGRIRECPGVCEMVLTELDFQMIELFYKYDDIKIIWLFSSVRGRLPGYLLKPLARAYENKARMKHNGKANTTEYALYKSLVNSAYGMTVTRLVTSEILMSDDTCEWYSDTSKFNYEKERKKAFLLPQWGIYVCAYSRYRILSAIHTLGSDACYSDTDSIKYIGNHDDYFIQVNKQTQAIMQNVCNMYNLDYDIFYDLGSFEKENNSKTFSAKFLGAKRYITKTDEGYESTIAGLPKNAMNNLFNAYKIQWEITRIGKYPDMFNLFDNNMLLNADISLKNAHTYNDEPHSEIIDGVRCSELSSVGIYPIDFTMKLSDFYMSLIAMQTERSEHYENRVY